MAKYRSALKTLPKHDPENNIGVVDRVRFAMAHARMDALTVDEKAQFKRWMQINDWIRDRRYVDIFLPGKPDVAITSHRILRNLVMSTFEMSYDTAERDIRNAKAVFVPIDDDNEYHRSVYIEQLEQRADAAAVEGDYSGSARLMELAVKLRRLLEAPKEQIEYDKIEALQFIIEYNPEAIGLKTIPNKEEVLARWQKKKALSDRMASDAEEARYDVG